MGKKERMSSLKMQAAWHLPRLSSHGDQPRQRVPIRKRKVPGSGLALTALPSRHKYLSLLSSLPSLLLFFGFPPASGQSTPGTA
jgi:hypothetical protein